MRKAFILFCLFCIAFFGKSFAQDIPTDSSGNLLPYRHGIYAEALGNGLYGSLSYERFFRVPIGNDLVAFRIGALIWPRTETAVLPVDLFWLSEKPWRIGKGSLRGEFGLGFTMVKTDFNEWRNSSGNTSLYSNTMFMPTTRVACRWQPSEKHYFLKFGLSAILVPYYRYVPFFILPLPSVGVGYSFGKKLSK